MTEPQIEWVSQLASVLGKLLVAATVVGALSAIAAFQFVGDESAPYLYGFAVGAIYAIAWCHGGMSTAEFYEDQCRHCERGRIE